MTTDSRDAHPYNMHEVILAQPEVLVRGDEPRFARADVSGRW